MISSLSFLYLRSCAGESVVAAQPVLDVLLLQAAQPLVVARDRVEGLQHLGLELGLDRGERERVLHVVVVDVAFAGRRLAAAASSLRTSYLALNGVAAAGAVAGAAACGIGAAPKPGLGAPGLGSAPGTPGAPGMPGAGRHRLGVGTRIGRLEIDDVAQEDLSLVELVAPDDDGLEGERAFAQARDHRLAAGLDALGDRDLALARQQLDRAHLAQIHAHRIVGALARLGLLGLGHRLVGDLDQLAVALLFLGFLGGLLFLALGLFLLDHVDAHLVEHREDVLDLLGGHLLGGQHRVDLLIGDVAALLGELDHLLDGGVGEVEQRQRARRWSPPASPSRAPRPSFLSGPPWSWSPSTISSQPPAFAAPSPPSVREHAGRLSPPSPPAAKSAVQCCRPALKRPLTLPRSRPPTRCGRMTLRVFPEHRNSPCHSIAFRANSAPLEAPHRTPRQDAKSLDRGFRSVDR